MRCFGRLSTCSIAGQSLNTENNKGETPLMIAVRLNACSDVLAVRGHAQFRCNVSTERTK